LKHDCNGDLTMNFLPTATAFVMNWASINHLLTFSYDEM